MNNKKCFDCEHSEICKVEFGSANCKYPSKQGGSRAGSGRKPAPVMVKICTKISKGNIDWLRAQKGKAISRQIDMAVTEYRNRER